MQQEDTAVNVKGTMLRSIIPGLGQFANGQVFKGVVFLALFIGFIIQ